MEKEIKSDNYFLLFFPSAMKSWMITWQNIHLTTNLARPVYLQNKETVMPV